MGRGTSAEYVPIPARPRLLVSSRSLDGSFPRLACLLGATPGRCVYRGASTSPGGEMSLGLRVCGGSEFFTSIETRSKGRICLDLRHRGQPDPGGAPLKTRTTEGPTYIKASFSLLCFSPPLFSLFTPPPR